MLGLKNNDRPLADRLRPVSLEELVGQEQLLSEGRPLRRALLGETLHSMVLWGPPDSPWRSQIRSQHQGGVLFLLVCWHETLL